jgi:hypothetical protein
MGIGRDLLDLPFAEMVRNLAIAIADGQTALDQNSLETLKALVNTQVEVITDITEIIEPYERDVKITVPDSGGGSHEETIRVTGARVISSGSTPISMNMVQVGLMPTFYQFTEATIEVRLAITMREERQGPVVRQGGKFLGLGLSRAHAASVDFRTANKYSYQASGASLLRTILRPVPPPTRLEPAVTTVNTLASPPTVNRTPV